MQTRLLVRVLTSALAVTAAACLAAIAAPWARAFVCILMGIPLLLLRSRTPPSEPREVSGWYGLAILAGVALIGLLVWGYVALVERTGFSFPAIGEPSPAVRYVIAILLFVVGIGSIRQRARDLSRERSA